MEGMRSTQGVVRTGGREGKSWLISFDKRELVESERIRAENRRH